MKLKIVSSFKYYPIIVGMLLASELSASGIEEMSEASSLWKMFLSLSFVLVLIPILLFSYKKLQNFRIGQNKSTIDILTVQSLGTKEKLVVVEVEGQRLLLGVTSNSITTLQELGGKTNFSELIEEENRHQNSLNEQKNA